MEDAAHSYYGYYLIPTCGDDLIGSRYKNIMLSNKSSDSKTSWCDDGQNR